MKKYYVNTAPSTLSMRLGNWWRETGKEIAKGAVVGIVAVTMFVAIILLTS